MANIVYFGTSLDCYLADKDVSMDWLQVHPQPGQPGLRVG